MLRLLTNAERKDDDMFEKLAKATDQRAARIVKHTIERLAGTAALPGVQIHATDDGIVLSGRNLRRRMLADPQLRNFGK